jgi:hypothetical protein
MNVTSAEIKGSVKGMKAAITGSISSIFGAGFSLATVTTAPILSDVAAVIAIIAAILTCVQLLANTRKIEAEREGANLAKRIKEIEFEAWLKSKCRDCMEPQNCAFPEHRPPTCKYSTSTEAKKEKHE